MACNALQASLGQLLGNVVKEIKLGEQNFDFDPSKEFEDMVSNVSHKTEDLISFLEQKLAELKEQNAKLQK